MIYVSKEQLSQVEYLIVQSSRGNHVLFDPEAVRKAFASGLTNEQSYAVEHHIEKLILLPTLAQKRAFLESLDREIFERVVKTYFSIVENNIFENEPVRH